MDITQQPAWTKLQQLFEDKKATTLRSILLPMPPGLILSPSTRRLHVDLSKNLVDAEVLSALIELAQQAGVRRAPCRNVWR